MRLLTAALLMALGVSSATAVAQTRPQPYQVQTRADGSRYLGSPIFNASRAPDLSENPLDNAVRVSDAAVEHVATGLTLPRTEGGCSLQWLNGLPQGGGFASLDRGGRGFYACADGAPAFVIFTFEADMNGFAQMPDDAGRALAGAGMALHRDPASLDCQETTVGALRQLTCRATTAFNGEQVTEIGLYIGQQDTFLKLNTACLPADCAAAQARLERFATVLGGDRLPAVAHPRD
ncbi:hypothetical protein [Brevundimonas sp.]|uniref:hypothetical protein n=1 Tax=Brevundimonas sp. TaxID=1871086 RepID=UPI003F71E33E